MNPVLLTVAVLGAGAVGAVVRYLAGRVRPAPPGPLFAVLVVNVVGSALAGAAIALAERAAISDDLRLVLVTGFCGGLTTFSAWSVDTVELALAGRWVSAAANTLGTLALGLAACALGYIALR